MIDYLKVGKIVNTHALQGEVRVISSSDFKEVRFKKGSALLIDDHGTHVPVQVRSHRTHKNFDLLTFVGMSHIDEVTPYKGCDILVDAAHLSQLDEGEFYFYEMIGCQVKTTQGEVIGEISEILQTGANDVWVIKRKGKKDALIPYIEDVVKAVDVANKTVTIALLEGLIQ